MIRNSSISIFILILSVLPIISNAQTYFSRITNAGSVNTSANGSFSSSWGDVNNDGLLDLLIISSTIKLNINNGDGTFTAANSGHLTQTSFFQNSAVFGDYDNDGNLDLYVSNLGPNTPIQQGQPLFPQINYLYRNIGPPSYRFELIEANGLDSDSNMTWTSSFVDFNNDGNLDVFVPGDQGDKDLFFENNGDGTFSENENLLFLNPGEFSAAGSWADFDNDGDEDLLIINYQGVNNELYKNELKENGITSFTKIVTEPIVLDQAFDLAPSFGDYDNDGDMDVFIGTWVGNNNLLFKNNGDFSFTKISGQPIVERTWTLAYTWLDFDNDGYLDVFVANSQNQVNTLYKNNGDETFTKATANNAGDILSSWGFTSGASTADYDNDGDIDIYVPGSQAALFRNNIGSNNNWLHVTCEGVQSNKSGIGAKVRVKAEISSGTSIWQLRHIHGGATGDRAQNSQRVHYGLGTAPIVDSLIVEWPSGLVDIYSNVEINQFFKAVEGVMTTSVVESSIDNDFVLHQNYPNPFNPTTSIKYEVSSNERISLKVYNVLGNEIATLVNERQPPGTHEVNFDASKLSTGVYYYTIRYAQFQETKKMLLLK